MEEAEIEAIALELLYRPEYRHRTLQVSREMHARKNPAAIAADAMERLMAFGGHHLRPHAAYSLSFVQFYMLDVLLALYLMLLTVLMIAGYCLIRCFACAARRLFGPNDLRL